MSRMLDALRHHKSHSRPRGTSPRRGGHAQSVLTSLGYAVEGSPKGSRNNLRLVLLAVAVGLAGVLAWQGVTRYQLLSMFSGAEKTSTSLADLVKKQPAVPVATRPADGGSPAASAQPPASRAAPAQASTQEPTPVEPSETQVTTEVAVKDSTPSVESAPAADTRAVVTVRVETGAPAPRRGARASAPASSRPAKTTASTTLAATPANAVGTAAPIEPKPMPAEAPVPKLANGETDHFKAALYYQRTGDFENALVQYRAVLQANEMNPEAHNNLGLLYQDKGLMEDAIREFRRATSIDGTYVKAHNNLGVALLKTGQVDAAVSELRALLGQEPRNVEVMTNLAIALRSSGRREEAREMLQRALAIKPRDATAHYNLALVFEENGEIVKAIEHYSSFLSFGGGEQATMAQDVRGRVGVLQARLQRLQ